jgi:uncharacterized membrane protein YheB (UPF0754 family)
MRNDKMADWIFGASAILLLLAAGLLIYNNSIYTRGFYFFAQSAFIGSAADWFAVTALFRKPLGIPFHTAIIPRHRKRLAQAVRRAVETRLVNPDEWEETMHSLTVSDKLEDAWASDKIRQKVVSAGAQFIREKVQELPEVLLSESGWQHLAERLDKENFHPETWAAGLAPHLLRRLTAAGKSWAGQPGRRDWLALSLRNELRQQGSGAWVTALQVGEAMGVIRYEDMADDILHAWIHEMERIEQENTEEHTLFLCECHAFCSRLFANADVQACLRKALKEMAGSEAVRGMIRQMTAEWKKKAGQFSYESLVEESISRLLALPSFMDAADREGRNLIYAVLSYEHGFLGDMVEDVLHRFSDERFNEFIYSKASEELGWIRINGALVGAAAGMAGFLFFSLFM